MKDQDPKKDHEIENSDERTQLSAQRSELAEHRTGLAEKRTNLSLERTRLSRERNHLANERTFQAWVRTALALIGFGMTISRFSVFLAEKSDVLQITYSSRGYSWIIGSLLILLGVGMLVVSYRRYMLITNQIGENELYPSKMLIFLVWMCILGAIGFIVFEVLNMM